MAARPAPLQPLHCCSLPCVVCCLVAPHAAHTRTLQWGGKRLQAQQRYIFAPAFAVHCLAAAARHACSATGAAVPMGPLTPALAPSAPRQRGPTGRSSRPPRTAAGRGDGEISEMDASTWSVSLPAGRGCCSESIGPPTPSCCPNLLHCPTAHLAVQPAGGGCRPRPPQHWLAIRRHQAAPPVLARAEGKDLAAVGAQHLVGHRSLPVLYARDH